MADPGQPFEAKRLDVASLVADHAPALYRYAYRLTGSAADAEDLTQQVFLTSLAKLDQLRCPEAVRAWLCAVLRRAYLRLERKPRPQPSSNYDVDVNLLAVDLPEEPSLDSEELQQAIDELPDEFKLVLVGFYFEDCSYKELAERLELPIGTVMSRLSRAKAFLRTRLLDQQQTASDSPAASSNGGTGDAVGRVRGKGRWTTAS
jgi:RNA polymerase sigma-70 factor (ECF subfamily)